MTPAPPKPAPPPPPPARSGRELVGLHLLDFEVRSGSSAECHHSNSREKSTALSQDAATPKVYPALSEFTGCQSPVVGLSETIRLMAEIDKVMEQHGGWPLK